MKTTLSRWLWYSQRATALGQQHLSKGGNHEFLCDATEPDRIERTFFVAITLSRARENRPATASPRTPNDRSSALNRLTRRRPVPRFGGHFTSLAIHTPVRANDRTSAALEDQCRLPIHPSLSGRVGVQSRRTRSRANCKLDASSPNRTLASHKSRNFQRPDWHARRQAGLLFDLRKRHAHSAQLPLFFDQLFRGRPENQFPFWR